MLCLVKIGFTNLTDIICIPNFNVAVHYTGKNIGHCGVYHQLAHNLDALFCQIVTGGVSRMMKKYK